MTRLSDTIIYNTWRNWINRKEKENLYNTKCNGSSGFVLCER